MPMPITLRNPWPKSRVAFYHNGVKSEDMAGLLLHFATAKQETILVMPAGNHPRATQTSDQIRLTDCGRRGY